MDSLNGEAKNCSRNFLNAFQSNKGHKCPPTYHIFKKSTKSKNKTVHKWYYYWNDPVTGVMHQKVCKGCKTRVEAYAFVSTLPPLFVEEKITIAKIAKWMYIPVPLFPKFRRNSRKKDIFSTEELNILFNESLWIDMSRNHYSQVNFLCVTYVT